MITEEEFIRISRFLKSRYGIDMSRKKVIVNGRLENYVYGSGYKSFGEFMDAVEQEENGEQERELVNLLTTNHTYFMREAEHFDYLRKEVLPRLKQQEAVNRDLRIWCAASSSGEEPYTLAMLLMDFFGLEHTTWDTKVLATDVSEQVLQQAMAGVYTAEQVEPLPEHWKRRFFRQLEEGEMYQATPELKREVLFRKFNLMEPFPFRSKLHVIFLRNVMIYFDERTRKELIEKVYEALEPGGYLFLGKTETLDKNIAPFVMIQPSIFRKVEGIKKCDK